MRIDLWGLDRYEQIGRITTYTGVQIIERDLAEGGWQVDMPLGDAGDIGAALIAADWPGIEVLDRDTGWRFGGYLTDYTVMVDEDGTESLRLIGKDFQSDLSGWLEWPDFDNEYNWWKVVYGGTIARTRDAFNTVRRNAGYQAAPGRAQIDGLTFGIDPRGGEPKARRLKGEPLLAVMRFLFADSLEWTARLRLVRNATGTGAVLFETPAREISPVVLDVKRGTFGSVAHTTRAANATWVVGMGAESDPLTSARLVSTYNGLEVKWVLRHREQFLNRPSTGDFATLDEETYNALVDPDSWHSQSAKVESARVEGFGRDLDIGWLVDVHLGQAFAEPVVRLPVVASTLAFTRTDGWVRTIDLGTETLHGPDKIHATIARTRAKIRQVENDIR